MMGRWKEYFEELMNERECRVEEGTVVESSKDE